MLRAWATSLPQQYLEIRLVPTCGSVDFVLIYSGRLHFESELVVENKQKIEVVEIVINIYPLQYLYRPPTSI